MLALALCLGPLHAQHGLVRREQRISGTSGGFGGVSGNDFRFGVSVAPLGDFDGDGTPDLAVGAHRANLGGAERGAIWLCFLRPDGTVKEQHEISSVSGGFTGQLDDQDRFGISIASLGDLDGDGTTDLAVGSYHDDDGGTNAGAVWILFLDPLGTVKAQQKISALEGGFPLPLAAQDSFGWAVEAIGDLDDDGVVELAIGSSRDDNGESLISRDYGAVYLCFLRPDGTVRAATKLCAGTPGLGPALRPRDRFGSDVCALGDRNGDGLEDIAVGAFADEPAKIGRVWVLDLLSDGSLAGYRMIGDGAGGFPAGQLELADRFGMSLAADDLDGDGLRDLFIGASGDDDSGLDSGALYACLLAADGSVRATDKISPRVNGFGGVVHADDWFGVSCAVLGDLDGDGPSDLAVGAYQDDDGGYARGAVWVLFRWGGTDLPAADYGAAPRTGPVPLSVAFTDRSMGLVTAWSWDFGDGTSSTDPSPLHTYPALGYYTVTLSVNGPQGTDQLARVREVAVQSSAAPVADFQCWPVSGEPPLTTSFQDLSSGEVTAWWWDFGDGGSSTLRDPEHSFAQVGAFDVSLTVSGHGGSSTKTVADLVTVLEPAPVAAFDAAPATGVAPLAVTFTDRSTLNVTSWSWDFGDGGGSSERHPQHVYANPGTYTVALAVTSAGGSHTLAVADLVVVTSPAPVAAFTAVPTSGVAPLAVFFTDQSTLNVTSWTWDFGDGSSSTARDPQHVYANPGTYSVSLNVTSAGGSASLLRPDLVNVAWPPPSADFTASPTEGPAPLAVSFTDFSTGEIWSWLWSFGDGAESNVRHPVHVYGTPGSYNLMLTVTGPGGSSTLSKPGLVTVTEPVPQAEFVGAPTSGTRPLTVAFTNQSTGSITGHAWSFGDGGSSTLASPSYTYTAAGTYTVTLTETGPGGTSTRSRAAYVVVNEPRPTAEFVGAPLQGAAPLRVSFQDRSTGVITQWEWDFGDGSYSSERNPTHVYRTHGSYTVRLRVTGPGGFDGRGKRDYVRVARPPGGEARQSPAQTLSGGTVQGP
jgi:PKD repeat protein